MGGRGLGAGGDPVGRTGPRVGGEGIRVYGARDRGVQGGGVGVRARMCAGGVCL